MNFLDPYDITGTSTPPQNPSEQSLNEEVSQVIGQLGRFWGGFRKQSQAALEIAKKDFTEVVSQAQKELGKLTADAPPAERSTTASDSNTEASAGPSSDDPLTSSTSTLTEREPSAGIQGLFTRLQTALPPNIVTTVQNNLPESLKHASDNIDLAQLRTTLTNEFQRVQGVTLAQAEEYVHKSEALLKEAMKEAGEVLKDAVKVIPPEQASGSSTPGVVWDGTDSWMLPSLPSDTNLTPNGKGKGREASSPSGDTPRAGATRAQSLLKRLKHNSEIVKLDPESDPNVQKLYVRWLATEVDAKEGGLEGSEWNEKISHTLNEPDNDQTFLQATHDELVPSEMTESTFWKRYFFRVYQIETEEEKRKVLLQGSIDNEEDFSWEDEDEEPTSPTPASKKPTSAFPHDSSNTLLATSSETDQAPDSPLTTANKRSSPPSRSHTPSNASPRESSEDSYDLVSSGNVSVSGDVRALGPEKTGDSDDVDSDWE